MGRKPKHIVEPIKDGSLEDIVESIFEKTLALKELVEQQEHQRKKKLLEAQSDEKKSTNEDG